MMVSVAVRLSSAKSRALSTKLFSGGTTERAMRFSSTGLTVCQSKVSWVWVGARMVLSKRLIALILLRSAGYCALVNMGGGSGWNCDGLVMVKGVSNVNCGNIVGNVSSGVVGVGGERYTFATSSLRYGGNGVASLSMLR